MSAAKSLSNVTNMFPYRTQQVGGIPKPAADTSHSGGVRCTAHYVADLVQDLGTDALATNQAESQPPAASTADDNLMLTRIKQMREAYEEEKTALQAAASSEVQAAQDAAAQAVQAAE
eukprot:COSAG02_NODE_16725_length_1060_cov_116.148803_1_plen_117_part_01